MFQHQSIRCLAAGILILVVPGCADRGPVEVDSATTPSLIVAPPDAPTTLSAVLGPLNAIDLAWSDASDGETAFQVFRRFRNPDDGVWTAWQNIASTAADAVTFRDETANPGVQFQYRVRACADNDCSAFTQRVTIVNATIPLAPSDLHSFALSTTAMRVLWTDGSTDETRFELQRRSRAVIFDPWGPWGAIIPISPDTGSATDGSVPESSLIHYRVRACNLAGCSAWVGSRPTLAAPIPSMPFGLGGNASRVNDIPQIDLGWGDASSNETRFELESQTFDAGTTTWSAWSAHSSISPNETQFTDTFVVSGTRYRYRIRACNINGCSAWENSVRIDAI